MRTHEDGHFERAGHEEPNAEAEVAALRRARDPGEPGVRHEPDGYPEEVDPRLGPLQGRDPGRLGDLRHPGAPHHDEDPVPAEPPV